jgi:hypothetical protein
MRIANTRLAVEELAVVRSDDWVEGGDWVVGRLPRSEAEAGRMRGRGRVQVLEEEPTFHLLKIRNIWVLVFQLLFIVVF